MIERDALKGFTSAAGATIITLFVAYFVTFLYKILLARYMGPSQFGLFEMAITLLGVGMVLGGAGFHGSIMRFIPLLKNKKPLLAGYLHTVLATQILISIFLSLLLFVTAPFITTSFGFPELFTSILYVVAVIIPFRTFMKTLTEFLLAHKKTLIGRSGFDIIFNSVILLGSIVIIFLELSVYEVIVLLAIAHIIVIVYYLFFVIKTVERYNFTSRQYNLKKWFSFSLPLLLASITGYLLSWTDNLVIGVLLTEYELGVYAVAFSIAFYLFVGTKLFATVFLPIMTSIYKKNKRTFKHIFSTIRSWALFFSLTTGAAFIIFSEQILKYLFGTEYVAGATSLQILTVFFIAANYFHFSHHLLMLEDQTKKIFYADIVTLVLNLAITIYLVQAIGILGAAIGSGFSYFFVRFSFHLYSKKYVTISHNYFYIIKSVVLTFTSAIISYHTSLFLLLNSPVNIVFYILFAGLLYVLLLFIGIRYLNIFDNQDLVVIEVIEQHTKLNLTALKRFLIRQP